MPISSRLPECDLTKRGERYARVRTDRASVTGCAALSASGCRGAQAIRMLKVPTLRRVPRRRIVASMASGVRSTARCPDGRGREAELEGRLDMSIPARVYTIRGKNCHALFRKKLADLISVK